MTSVDLDAARKAAREAQERADKATPGPWRVGGAYHPREETKVAEGGGWILAPGSEQLVRSTGFDFDAYRARCPGNVAFIAAARSDVPELAALVLAMAEEVERLRSDVPAPQERAILDALKVDLALIANPSTTFEDAVKNGQRDSHWFRLAIDYLSRPR